jgi:hypothetical protein
VYLGSRQFVKWLYSDADGRRNPKRRRQIATRDFFEPTRRLQIVFRLRRGAPSFQSIWMFITAVSRFDQPMAFTFFLQLPSFQTGAELYPNRRREPR